MTDLLNPHQDFTEPDHRWSEGEQALKQKFKIESHSPTMFQLVLEYAEVIQEGPYADPEIEKALVVAATSDIYANKGYRIWDLIENYLDLKRGHWPELERALIEEDDAWMLVHYAVHANTPWDNYEAEKIIKEVPNAWSYYRENFPE